MHELLTVDEAAERLNTGVRFVRRLIAERRIEFVKLGTHVRISNEALGEYIAANCVPACRPGLEWQSGRESA
jgi:excisionase family DNA binding protein